MTHQVVWMPRAARALAVIWNAAYDRELIAHAIDSIHTELAEDAHEKGESRDDGFRIFFATPLAVLFWCNERATQVSIANVWTTR